jgi:hypothetical protein
MLKTIAKVMIKIFNAESLNIMDTTIGITNERLKNITKMLKRFNKGLKFIFI